MHIALAQMTATADLGANRAVAAGLLEEAAGTGATVAVLPELWHVSGPAAVLRAAAEPLDGPTVTWLRERAQAHGLWVVGGTVVEAPGGAGARPSNTCLVIDPSGEITATYRKTHLFDCDVEGARFAESGIFEPGSELVVTEIAGVQCGLAVCFDLRFGEQFAVLAERGAKVVLVPSAFTARTGRDHWELLVRSRALDAQLFVAAADQCGSSAPRMGWHGHSMVADPWGAVLVDAGTGPGLVHLELDLGEVDRVRAVLPVVDRPGQERTAWPRT